MKLHVIAILLCFLHQALSQARICLHNCRDIANPTSCNVLSNQCQSSTMIRSMCPLTCKLCTNCKKKDQLIGIVVVDEDNQKHNLTSQCELEKCKDLAPVDQCSAIKNVIPNGCSLYPQACRLTCGQCKPCAIPKPEQKCTADCGDYDNSCKHWKSEGYCKKSSVYYPFTSQKCPLSCGICKVCATPKPINTALPPTPQTCSKTCSDINESCEYWKEKGFCKQTKKFPYLLEVCAMTCGACKLCPTEAPTTTSCSEDCKDANDNCEHWQEEGHCGETSKFPYTREICPKSCGICTACSDQEDRSTALPHPRKQN